MTDTTDIAALMLKMRNLADRIIDAEGENNNGEVGKIIEMYDDADTTFKAENILLVLSAFEEQRQRAADLVLHVNTQANMREKAEEKYTEVSGWYVKMKTRMLKAEAEIAQLVNRERLAITDDMAVAFHAATTDSAIAQDDMEEIKAGLLAVQELFTAPQKPVVLPHGYKPYLVRSQTTATRAAMTSGGEWLHRDEVTAAIEAAGGIVSTSDERMMQDMSDVVKDGE